MRLHTFLARKWACHGWISGVALRWNIAVVGAGHGRTGFLVVVAPWNQALFDSGAEFTCKMEADVVHWTGSALECEEW